MQPYLAAMMYEMTYGQHQLVYNFTSFTLACMMACTVFFWLRLRDIADKYRTALAITGLVRAAAPNHVPLLHSFWHTKHPFVILVSLIARAQVTFIAFYHYVRIFNSWVDAYNWPTKSEFTAHLK